MEIPVPKGQRTRVINLWGGTVPGTLRFSARTINGESATGRIDTVLRKLGKTEQAEYPLGGQNSFDTQPVYISYQFFVTPDEDTTVYFETRHIEARHLFWALVALATAVGALAAVPYAIEFINAL